MATRKSAARLPVHYPSIPDADATPGVHDEPPVRVREDRVPGSRLGDAAPDSIADLRLAIERLLQRKESFDRKPWEALGERAGALMVEMLADDAMRAQPALFHRLIAALAELGEVRATAPLGAVLRDNSAPAATRAFAANALGRLGAPSAVDSLTPHMADKDDMIRRQVAMALGRLASTAAVPPLLVLARDTSPAVNEVAIDALRRWEERLGQRLLAGAKPQAPRKATGRKKVVPAPERG